MISKTQISKRIIKKKNPEIVDTINLAKKNGLLKLAKMLSSSRRNYNNINLNKLEKIEGDKVIVVGKVLGSGEINKKLKISALGFSKSALDKLKNTSCEIRTIKQELENNPKLKGVKVI